MKKFLILASTLVFSFYVFSTLSEAQFVEDGLISYWSFDAADIDGDTAKDIFGDHDGTIFGDPEVVEGQVGEALEFDGTGDYVEIPETGDWSEYNEFTIDLWMNTYNLSGNHELATKDDGWYLEQRNRTLFFVVHGAAPALEPANTLESETWYHVVGTQDGDELKLYLNGEEIGSRAHADVPAANLDFYIGVHGHDNSLLFNGAIDEVRFYSRALNENEVMQNFEAEGFKAVNSTGKLALTWGEVKISR